MSKKNKRKFASQASSSVNTDEKPAATKEASAEKPAKPQENGSYNMNKELKNLIIIAIILICLLIGLYYYDQQTHILQQFTDRLFALF